jgi:hypothetical protein
MRTTLALDDDLILEAQRLTGIHEKSMLVRQALRALRESRSVHSDRRRVIVQEAAVVRAGTARCCSLMRRDHTHVGDRPWWRFVLSG